VRDPWIHLHHHLGVADLAKDLPERWRRGEISYNEWARLDASFWCGNSRETLAAALETSPFREGARELIAWFIHWQIPCVGISSGLSIFNDITARELGMQEVISNQLHFDGEIYNGEISIKVHEHNKGEIMDELMQRYSVRAREIVAFGDGTADIPLLQKAGLGVAICPSNERVRSSAERVVEDEPIDGAIVFVEEHFRVKKA
jgi:phosphoserine phosphatase